MTNIFLITAEGPVAGPQHLRCADVVLFISLFFDEIKGHLLLIDDDKKVFVSFAPSRWNKSFNSTTCL